MSNSRLARASGLLAVIVLAAAVAYWQRWAVLALFADVTRPMFCNVTTYRTATDPTGEYVASVVENDCGALSSRHRQVVIRKGLFRKQTLFFFNGAPPLDVSWSEKTLLVHGPRSLSSMDRPPPGQLHWEGVKIQYIER